MDKETNVIIRYTADLGGLDESNQKISELRQKNRELWADYDKLDASRKASAEGTAKEVGEIKKVVKEIDSNQKSIERLEKSMKKVPEAIPEKAVEKSFRAIKREIENQIKSMEMLGKTGTSEYQKLIKEAGRLADIEGDVARQIKGIASDTAGFDLIMEGTQGIAAGFQVAQGTAALFGVEQEKLMPMMVKLQALMAVTTGLQQIQNTIQKESYVMRAVSNLQLTAAAKAEAAHARAIAIKTGAQKGSTVALAKATVAQKIFNLVAKSNPYVLLAMSLIAVVGALMLFSSRTDKSADMQKKMSEELDLGVKANERYIESLKAKGATEAEIAAETIRLRKEEADAAYNAYYLIAAEAGRMNDAVKSALDSSRSATEKFNDSLESGLNMIYAIKSANDDKKLIKQYGEVEGAVMNINRRMESQLSLLYDLVAQGKIYAGDMADYADAIRENTQRETDDVRKKEIDKQRQQAEQYRNLVKKNEQDLQNTLLQLMDDGKEKELKYIEISYAQKMEAVNKSADKDGKLRKALVAAREKEIADLEKKYADEAVARTLELEALKAENAADGSPKSIALKKISLEKQAELEIAGIEKSEQNEELRAEKIKAVRIKLDADLEQLDKDSQLRGIDYAADIRNEELRAERILNERILIDSNSTYKQKATARERLKNFELEIINSEMTALTAKHSAGLIDEENFNIEKKRLLNESAEHELNLAREVAEQKKELQQAVFDNAVQLGQLFLGLNRERLQREMEDLDYYYTTDAEEARKNSDKKLISEKELARKKLEIKRKQAQAEKNEALFNVAVSTAQAIMSSAKIGFPQAIPFVAMAAALGVIQAAAVASKPLPRYWKGRKGGNGEMAWIGENGPELMWIPSGASVVPNHVSRDITVNKRHDLLKDWNIPGIYNIEMPRVSKETIREVHDVQRWEQIDYDKVGKSIAKYIKTGRAVENNVNVTVDNGGVAVEENGSRHYYRNRKYVGVWN